jgi:ATP-dependent Clp protease protease subunit
MSYKKFVGRITKPSFKKPIRNDDDEEEEEVTEANFKSNIYVNGNRIMFYSPITQKTCFELIQAIDQCISTIKMISVSGNEKPKIYLHINSPGGDVYQALGVVSHIQNCPYDIVTVCEGYVASAGTIISLAGKHKMISKYAYMLIHEIRSGCWGRYSECLDDIENCKKIMKDLRKFMNKQCGNNEHLMKKMDKLLKHDLLLSPKKCLKYGLVDEIF